MHLTCEALEVRLAPATASLSSATYTVSEGSASAIITVNLSAAPGVPASVQYATGDGSATNPADYTSASGNLAFLPFETSKTFVVYLTADTADEDDETVNITLSSPSNLTLGSQSSAVLTITDNDDPPTVQLSTSNTLTQPEAVGQATFTVTLSAASGKPVTVAYASASGTGVSGTDFSPAAGTATFDPGETSKTFAVTLTNDALDENDETFAIGLSSPSNATLGTPSSQTVTIADNDDPPTVQFSSATAAVGESLGVTLTVTLSAASGRTATVAWA